MDDYEQKNLFNSEVRIEYESREETFTVFGRFMGIQLVMNEEYFVLIQTDEYDRFIPADRIIHIDVINAETVDKNSKNEHDVNIQ